MRPLPTSALLFLTASLAGGQTAPAPQPSLPKDPDAVFVAAAPYYDFSNAGLKPWHLIASFQLYDDQGKASENGTYEYWWASPQVYRTAFKRPSSTQSYWHTIDGKHTILNTGEARSFAEDKLEKALFSPLPMESDLDPKRTEFQRENFPAKGVTAPCFMLVPQMKIFGADQNIPLGLFPTYCFDENNPVLLAKFSMGSVAGQFNKIVKVQGRYLPREVTLSEHGHKILSATVDSITGLSPSDPALTPPADAQASSVDKINVAGGLATGMLIKEETPIYPGDAKAAHVSGTVVLQAIIGTDGGIHNLQVLQAPWPSLAQNALWAVSHWRYRPYLLNGQPVEVETTVNVVYSLGQ